MEVRNIENTTQARMNGEPYYTVHAVAAISQTVTSDERTYTFSARALRIETPRCERYTVWYKGELQPKLYRTLDTAIARAKRLIRADAAAAQKGWPAPW